MDYEVKKDVVKAYVKSILYSCVMCFALYKTIDSTFTAGAKAGVLALLYETEEEINSKSTKGKKEL